MYPEEWPERLKASWGHALNDPATWAKEAVECGADIVALGLSSAHPEGGDTGAAEARINVDKVLSATDLPLIVIGPEVPEKDNEVLIAASEVARGQRIALGNCIEKSHRAIAAACISDGHVAIGFTPTDINLAKQLNVQLCDVGVTADSILIDPTSAALGYGMEYCYSVMERIRLAALTGESMTAMPMIAHVGSETWRQKESRAGTGVPSSWGDLEERSVMWEAMTAATLLHGGADIVVLRHPKAVEQVRSTIDRLIGPK
jgi:acetyl-CoA decarbonylase/synthase complex subunit delta